MEEFRKCPACGYERGFHVYFNKNKESLSIGLICPDCGQSFDIGWYEDKKISMKITEGTKY